MEDEVLKQKYRSLQSKLYVIKEKLNELDNNYDSLVRDIKESVLIDDKMVKEELLNSVNKNVNDIYIEVVNGIIPRINNKI